MQEIIITMDNIFAHNVISYKKGGIIIKLDELAQKILDYQIDYNWYELNDDYGNMNDPDNKKHCLEEIKDTLMNDHYAIIEDLNFTAEELDYDRDKVKEHDEQYEYIQEILKDIENFKQQQAEEDLEM
jgi:hypothetical protein